MKFTYSIRNKNLIMNYIYQMDKFTTECEKVYETLKAKKNNK